MLCCAVLCCAMLGVGDVGKVVWCGGVQRRGKGREVKKELMCGAVWWHASDFFQAEDRYMELLEAREQAMQSGGGGWGEAQRKELEKAEEILADSTRVALRLLKVRARLCSALHGSAHIFAAHEGNTSNLIGVLCLGVVERRSDHTHA